MRVAIFVAAIFTILAFRAYADDKPLVCSCANDFSPDEQQIRNAFQGSDYVALVEVASISRAVVAREENWAVFNPATGQSDESIRMVDKPLLVAQFNLLRIWKGEKSATTIETPADVRACGFEFQTGLRYLLFAYGPDDDGRVETSRCMRTAIAEAASADIAVLDAIKASAYGAQQSKPARPIVAKSLALYQQALGLIHAYTGAGDELERAMDMAESLLQTDPGSGYSQTLTAEALSTWELGLDGEPAELREHIIQLADEALRLDPKLAQAHVAKARALARAMKIPEAEAAVSMALEIDPKLEGAIFQQAEIYRLSGDFTKGEAWFRSFIATTPDAVRKSNGYYWMGKMFQDTAYRFDEPARHAYLLAARNSYQQMVDLNPKGAWPLLNFAIFLNSHVADFDEAEVYAEKALAVMEFPLARYHLAAARYQKLGTQAQGMNAQSLSSAAAQIESSTAISLDRAVEFKGFGPRIESRLTELQNKVGGPRK